MVTIEELEQKILEGGKVLQVMAEGDGYHYEVTVVSDEFAGLSRLARQQWVYALVGKLITEGRLHALTIHTFTSAEWEQRDG